MTLRNLELHARNDDDVDGEHVNAFVSQCNTEKHSEGDSERQADILPYK